MNNCTNVKFKGSYNDDSLYKPGEFRIFAPNVGGTEYLYISSSSGSHPIEEEYVGGGQRSSQTSINLDGKTLKVLSKYWVSEIKSDMSYIKILGNPSEFFKYAEYLSDIRINFDEPVDLSVFADIDNKTRLHQLRLNSPVLGNINSLSGYTSLTVIILYPSNDLVGDITSLSNLINIESFGFANCVNIVGEINDFAESMAEVRTTGSLVINCIHSGMTDDGNELTQSYLEGKGGTRISLTFDSSIPGGYRKSYI